ncbi:MAG: hypothetical protein M0P14_03975 [Alkaliphilus sp.]|nr:hypothetical protein [Alkaliphilus sp.]
MARIKGTQEQVKPVEVIKNKVYMRRNIVRTEEEGDEGFSGWEYDEIEVPIAEYMSYMELLGQQNTDLELHVIEQGQYITDLELRILELEAR